MYEMVIFFFTFYVEQLENKSMFFLQCTVNLSGPTSMEQVTQWWPT